ncbi:CHAP domain-containing protein [Actinomadura decatromicini]|uniref:CHAP domain-containing protein n=1 Tax=Actinomadura decatromicini TaxID=2604572 RepID=A0A5D3F2G0_9ACTN|nr:CHAP domain-containing protein [Actinomadura decatromicini]TYK43197.1 CHAP domain-containing protein [Actinomadura decatromicini]
MSATGMIKEARKSLGLSGRPNKITREYADRHGSEFESASWCDMAVTYWARHSGNAAAVLLGGDRAYTVWHAEDFKKAGRWHAGTTANVNRAKPGDIVFFDWGTTDRISAVDHVGVVEKVLGGGRLQTIEANTDDAVKRRVRAAGVIAGYGRPAYGPSAPPRPTFWDVQSTVALRRVRVPWGSPVLREGSSGGRVKWLQDALNGLGSSLNVDGEFGRDTKSTVVDFQKDHRDENGDKLSADGDYGDHTARALFLAHGGAPKDAV